MNKEITLKPMSGYGMLLVCLICIAGIVVGFISHVMILPIILIPALLFFVRGFIIINPNEANVLILFGTYKGTIKESGFHWVNPFYLRTFISLRAKNLNGQSLKVNDKIGNPIEIAAVIVW